MKAATMKPNTITIKRVNAYQANSSPVRLGAGFSSIGFETSRARRYFARVAM